MDENQKYFQNAALERGSEYFEYENYEIQISNEAVENYEIMDKIGRGKYSDVFKCMNIVNEQLSVLKILKPVRQGKIKRQIKILKTLRGKESIINLQAVMLDKCSNCYCLAYPFVDNIDIRDASEEFLQQHLRHYIFQILKGLQNSHSMGIMHRDIKPQNVLFDKKTKNVEIADWGLADYFLPGKQYNVRVASRYYKGPELLLNNKYYGYSLDIWSLGCVFGGLIFQQSVIFRGGSNHDQVRVILQKVGTPEIQAYVNKYKLKPDKEVIQIIRQKARQKQPWSKMINSSNSKLATKQALDLLQKMLVVDHHLRITPTEAMKHPYFQKK